MMNTIEDPSPSMTVSPASLSGFITLTGYGPVFRTDLYGQRSGAYGKHQLPAPSNYEISTGSSAGFSPTDMITLTQSSGSVASTTIYVRLRSGLPAGSYDEEDITISTAGASDQTVICSGLVEDSSPKHDRQPHIAYGLYKQPRHPFTRTEFYGQRGGRSRTISR
ncbi:MAG: hypothetical protein U5N26_09530 [Candidatus Marinimicrobia bacterium]|nr:hypothetical protein [Candidatus Neomarinimicrobiota bacterium]